MYRVIIVLLCSIICLEGFCEERTLKVDKEIKKEEYKNFISLIEENLKNLKVKFKVEINNLDKMEYSTKEYSFKIKRKTPIIGELIDIPKAKWKKEKIRIIAKAEKNTYFLNFIANIYNKRDKKWHELKAPADFFENIFGKVFFDSLKDKKVFSIGSPIVLKNNSFTKINNLLKFKINDVHFGYTDTKAVDFILIDENLKLIKVSIPFIANIKTINDIFISFMTNFTYQNLRKGVSKKYDFYWEYAKHGEIMDGMHKNQIITALGQPLKIENCNNNEKLTFNIDGKYIIYTLINDELRLNE